MNQPLRYLFLSASIAAAASAAPFMAIGDGAELFVTGALGVRADDNIMLASNNEESDIIFSVTPGVELTFGKNAQFQGSLTAADEVIWYGDHDELNTNLASVNLVTKYDDGKTKLNTVLGYNEINQNTVDIRPTNGRLIRRNLITAAANGEVEMSELTSIGGGISFRDERYKRAAVAAGYVDNETASVPVNVYYSVTPKVDLSLGYQYSEFRARNLDSADHFYNVGTRGEFTPKLTGRFAIGVTERRFDHNRGNRTQLGLDSSLAYEFSPKTSLQVGATNQFGTSPTGIQQRNLTVNTLLSTRLNEEWAANAGVNYRRIAWGESRSGTTVFAPSSDDYWEAVLGGSYIINANIRLTASYTFRTYKAEDNIGEFDNNVFALAANFRY